jgi:hypothetical protein
MRSNPNSKPGLVLNLAWKRPAKGRFLPVKFKVALSKRILKEPPILRCFQISKFWKTRVRINYSGGKYRTAEP